MKVMEFGSLMTADPGMQQVMQIAKNVAPSKATVLITGESGTGKELVARYIHDNSPRASRRMVAINCAAVPETLLESELFGYEKGAFTGAVQLKEGKFELASDSTLLLDELSELPLPLQAKLLRVIQEGEVERLGGKQPVKVNVRIIATSNRNLREMVQKGQFREDLYYRLNVIPLEVPSLSRRPLDIEVLARQFVKISCMVNSMPLKQLSEGAVHVLRGWKWPGNVRELENVMERSVLLSTGNLIEVHNIDLPNAKMGGQVTSFGPGMTVQDAEKILIMQTLSFTNQNRTKAAELLGISIRTLRNKLHEYNAEVMGE